MNKIPPPSELGFKDITKWRPVQEEMINVIITGQKRVDAMCAPTGAGKSHSMIAGALLSGQNTCIVTSTKGLQDQYMRIGKPLGMTDLRGRRNYSCDMKEGATCEEGYNARCPYKGTVACECSQAEIRAATSRLVVTNYDKWCAARRFGQGMDHFTQVIFDEGDESVEALCRTMQVILNHKEIEDNLKLDFPVGADDDFGTWKCWASAAKGVAEVAMIAAQARISGLSDPKLSWVRHFTHMRNLFRRLSTLAAASPKDWIVEQIEDGYQFDPIRPARYAEAALLLRVPRIIFVSATLRPKTMFMCGLPKEAFDFCEFNSDFDPARCPIYYVPTMRVDARTPDRSLLWMRLDQWLARRQDRKGLIQTTSYQYQKEVQQFSRFSDRMLLNERGEPTTRIIEQYLQSAPGTSLVSPSVGRGYDFKGDAARYNVILKLPFEPPSKILKAREEDDREYRPYKTFQKLVQQLGRDMREKEDWSERAIFDDHYSWFGPRYGHLAPRSFHAFVRTTSILPQPPKLGSL